MAIVEDPLGSRWQILASLPIDAVRPTTFQRDPSETHVARLADAIDKLDRFLDPIVAIVVPEPEVAHRILALNTEKAHNLRARAAKRFNAGNVKADLVARSGGAPSSEE